MVFVCVYWLQLLQFLVSLCRGQKRGISLKRPIMSAADFDSGQQVAKISRLDSSSDRPQYEVRKKYLIIVTQQKHAVKSYVLF